jgi:CRISPR-associated protein Cas8a1/Csx13
MARELVYRLTNPNYSSYHRAALGGLAATVQAWGRKGGSPPPDIEYELGPKQLRLAWTDALTDQEALRRILDASFRVTSEGLIDLVGQGIPAGEIDLRLAIHNGLCGTFLQHHQKRRSEKQSRHVEIRDADGLAVLFSYKAVLAYAHQTAHGTGLLDQVKKGNRHGVFPQIANVPQSVVPGAMTGKRALEASAEEAILLLFLMVGTSVFLIRSKAHREKMQFCLVVPRIDDLVLFARALHAIASNEVDRPTHRMATSTRTYAGRIAGGPEEAALRLLIDLAADDVARPGISGAQAIAMGAVAWDKNQVNRSASVALGLDYPELPVFRAANTFLGKTRILRSASGEGYAIRSSAVPELVAENLGAGNHWAASFRALVGNKKDFKTMLSEQKGLHEMKQAIRDEDDRAIIGMFQEAWRRTMGQLYERARREGAHADRLLEVEREKIRNAFIRTRTADALAGWFLRFCADATKGGSISAAQKDPVRLRQVLFDQRNAQRVQNLFLFALVSYAKEEFSNKDEGEA